MFHVKTASPLALLAVVGALSAPALAEPAAVAAEDSAALAEPTADSSQAVTEAAAPAVLAQSSALGPGCDDCFLDLDGTYRRAAPAYSALHNPGKPHRLQAVVAVSTLLALGSLWYWIDDRNIADWDRPALEQRITGEAWRMDNNTFPMNFALHALSGSGYYALARASNLGVWESATYSFLTSTFWEYVLEFKEKISINDMMVTPGAGMTIGEFAHKLSFYLNSSPRPTRAQRVAAWTLGPSVAISRAIHREPPRPTVTDNLGYSSALWHDFELGYAIASTELEQGGREAVHQYGFRGTIVSVPGFLRPGRFRRWFYQSDFSALALTIEHSTRGAGVRLLSDTALAGYVGQSMGYAAQPRGVAGVVGGYLAYRYTTSRTSFEERMAVLHFPGPGFDVYARARGVEAHLLGRAHLDFAGIGPLAYPEWKVAHPEAREKSILRKQDYYFGWGGSVRAAAELRLGALAAATEVLYGSYDSAEGLDRTQDKVTADVNATDVIAEQTTRLELRPPRAPIVVGGFIANRRWRSQVGSNRQRADVSSIGARVAVTF